MITYEGPGDIFLTGLQTMVCPVNTVGVMGAGLALAFKQRVPGLFVGYHTAVRAGRMTIHKPYIHPGPGDKLTLCLATKEDWRRSSDLKYVRAGLASLAKHYEEWGITSLSVPMLGCGLGDLKYEDVRPEIYRYLDPLPIPVEILTYG